MAVTVRRPGRFVDYFAAGIEEPTDAETCAGTVEDGAQELRCLTPLLPPIPEYARPMWKRNVLAFAVSLAASSALLVILVRCVGP